LFAQLRKAGLIQSVRGALGGYVLSKPPAEILVSDIMNVLEGTVEISDCIDETSCANMDCCATRLLWVKIKDSIDQVLESTTLADIVVDYDKLKENREGVKMDKNKVYMDYAATTYVKPEVTVEMLPFMQEFFGNPSSIYALSRDTQLGIEKARNRVAKVLNASKDEIYFTGGGSEADNWALKGVAFALKQRGNHIITTKIEHHAILHACEFLAKNGFDITYLPVDQYGFVNPEDVKRAITDKTILVSVMFANNEIGTIEPIKEIGAICRERKVLFHTDAVQAVGHIPIDVKEMNIDLLSLAAHKFYGPKGVGALYVRKGVKLENLIHGGGQERGRRAGTENIAGIVGLGKALELAAAEIETENRKLLRLKDKLIEGLLKIPYTKLNGPVDERRLPGNVNVCFEFIEGESILLLLDSMGVCASSGSACTSGSLDPSHVLVAIGVPPEIVHGSLRLSMGSGTDAEDVEKVLTVLPGIVERLRSMSPLWREYQNKEMIAQ
ncbi:MAG TPA: cysteine desulfurase NifS, partial [Firmicutes bacterium]|nr:cysteine desulfurase NifS [Bacillota bacterium]